MNAPRLQAAALRGAPLAALAWATLLPSAAEAQCLLDRTVASDAETGDYYGSTVSAGRRWMVTGAEHADAGGFDKGQVYVLERSGGQWTEHSILTHSDAEDDDRFGHAAALSGDRLVVGARYNADFGYGTGSAYVFEFDGTSWVETAKLMTADAGQGDFIGGAVAIDGDRVLVSAHGHDYSGASNSGAAYVFELGDSGWSEVAKLVADDFEAGDRFGERLALSGDRAVLGAIGENGDGNKLGAAYVFERGDDDQWFQAAKLTAPDGVDFDRFGNDVSIDGDTVVVGGSLTGELFEGGAYVFGRGADGVWSFAQKLTPLVAMENAQFGHDVSIDGERVLVTAQNEDLGAINAAGAAHLFERQADGQFAAVAVLNDKVGGPGYQFGNSADLFGDVVAVGMRGSQAAAGFSSGELFLFGGSGTTTPFLDACPGEISVATGGSQTFELWAGEAQSGRPYLILGSLGMAGTSVVVGGAEIPLSTDPYFALTIDPTLGGPLSGATGVLDSDGRATASFVLPPSLSPGLAGLALRHAYVVIEPGTLAITKVSDAVALSLVD